MEKKALSITDFSSCTKDSFSLPSIKPVYKGPSSGFIQKVKVLKTKNSVVYLPDVQTTLAEYQFQRSRILTKGPKTQSLENLHCPIRQPSPGNPATGNGPATSSSPSRRQQKPSKLMTQSMSDIPDILERELCNTDSNYRNQFFNISQSLNIRDDKSSNKGIFPPINSYSKFHCPTKPTPHGYIKPDFQRRTSNRLLRNPFKVNPLQQFLRSRNDPKKSIPPMSFVVSGQSMTDGKKTHDEGGLLKWKSGCECLRCDLIQKQYQDKDMSAYHMWGKYPCNHAETQEAENNKDSKTQS